MTATQASDVRSARAASCVRASRARQTKLRAYSQAAFPGRAQRTFEDAAEGPTWPRCFRIPGIEDTGQRDRFGPSAPLPNCRRRRAAGPLDTSASGAQASETANRGTTAIAVLRQTSRIARFGGSPLQPWRLRGGAHLFVAGRWEAEARAGPVATQRSSERWRGGVCSGFARRIISFGSPGVPILAHALS